MQLVRSETVRPTLCPGVTEDAVTAPGYTIVQVVGDDGVMCIDALIRTSRLTPKVRLWLYGFLPPEPPATRLTLVP